MNFNLSLANKFWIKLILGVFVFVFSLAAYHYPVYKKGYPVSIGFATLSQARNFAISGTYQYENSDGVILSSMRAGSESGEYAMENLLPSIIYGQVFKYFHLKSMPLDWLVYIGVVLGSLFNVIIFGLLVRMFGTIAGFISSIILALFPLRVVEPISVAHNEFGLLFFALALWFYLGSKQGPLSASLWRLGFFSALFALAALARNAFSISFPAFALFDFYKHRSFKRSLILILPFLLIFGSTLTPYSWLGAPNSYLADFQYQSTSLLGEVFPDPYTAKYERETFIANLQAQGLRGSLDAHFLKDWGYDVSLWDKIKSRLNSAIFYIKVGMSLTALGGPLVIFLMLCGLVWLYQNKRELLYFFVLWLGSWFAILVLYETSGRGHFHQIMPIAASTAGLGIIQLVKWFELSISKKAILGFLLVVLTVGQLINANKWKLFEAYESTDIATIVSFGERLHGMNLPAGVIAADMDSNFARSVNYFLDRDVIYFAESTAAHLIETGGLQDAFKIYEVSVAVGFSENTSNMIESLTGIETIKCDPCL